MSYLESLARLEPSPLSTLPRYDVAYEIPNGLGWHVHQDCSPWGAWWLVKACVRLKRPYRVRDETGVIWHGTCFLLHLFSYRLSGRCGTGTEL
jgi:hypothetical protein